MIGPAGPGCRHACRHAAATAYNRPAARVNRCDNLGRAIRAEAERGLLATIQTTVSDAALMRAGRVFEAGRQADVRPAVVGVRLEREPRGNRDQRAQQRAGHAGARRRAAAGGTTRTGDDEWATNVSNDPSMLGSRRTTHQTPPARSIFFVNLTKCAPPRLRDFRTCAPDRVPASPLRRRATPALSRKEYLFMRVVCALLANDR